MMKQPNSVRALRRPKTLPNAASELSYSIAMGVLSTVKAAVSVVDCKALNQPIVFIKNAVLAVEGFGRSKELGRDRRLLQNAGTAPATVAPMQKCVANVKPVQTVMHDGHLYRTTYWDSPKMMPLAKRDGLAPKGRRQGYRGYCRFWLWSSSASDHSLRPFPTL